MLVNGILAPACQGRVNEILRHLKPHGRDRVIGEHQFFSLGEDFRPLLEIHIDIGPGQEGVRLENGQVWVQTNDKSIRAKNVSEAGICSASLGSCKMKLDGGLAFRVRREQ